MDTIAIQKKAPIISMAGLILTKHRQMLSSGYHHPAQSLICRHADPDLSGEASPVEENDANEV
jgi:hypothetical protein